MYLDDGETFDYTKGHFLHRAFSLKDGVFNSTSADANAAFLTTAWIEKVSPEVGNLDGSRLVSVITKGYLR